MNHFESNRAGKEPVFLQNVNKTFYFPRRNIDGERESSKMLVAVCFASTSDEAAAADEEMWRKDMFAMLIMKISSLYPKSSCVTHDRTMPIKRSRRRNHLKAFFHYDEVHLVIELFCERKENDSGTVIF